MVSEFISVPITKTTEVQTGNRSFIYIFLRGISRGTGVKVPIHAFSLNASEFDSAGWQAAATGGRSVVHIVIADNTLNNVTFTLTINGVDNVYTFKTSPAGANDVEVGSDDDTSAANLKVAIDADNLGVTVVVATNTVDIYSTTQVLSGATSDGAKLTLTEPDTASKWDLDLSGQVFSAGTQHITEYPIVIQTAQGATNDIIFIVANVPANATAVTTIARIKALFGNALAGTVPTNGYGYVFSLNNATRAQMSAALQLKFGAVLDTAFVIATGPAGANTRLTMQLATTNLPNLDSSYEFIRHTLGASTPSYGELLGIDGSHQPFLPGIGPGILLGTTREIKPTDAPATVVMPQDTAFVDEGTYLTGLTSSITAIMNRQNNAFLQALAAGSSLQSFGVHDNYVLVGGGGLQHVGVVILTETVKPRGQFHADIYPDCVITGGRNRNFAKGSVDGLPLTISPQSSEDGAPIGCTRLFRQIDQA